jgi:hypothetical protein
MSRVTTLLPEDAEWINDLIDGEVNGGEVVVTKIAEAVAGAVRALAEGGDDQAERSLIALGKDGMRSRVEVRLKDDRTKVRLTHSGQVLSIPTRFGAPVRNDDGEREKYWQRPLWWEMPWPEFQALVDRLVGQRGQLTERIDIFQFVLTLHDKHMDTETPAEACEREGIDPRSFDVAI